MIIKTLVAMCVCARARVRVCVSARVCARACARACVCVCIFIKQNGMQISQDLHPVVSKQTVLILLKNTICV